MLGKELIFRAGTLLPILAITLAIPAAALAQDEQKAGLDDARIAHIAVMANAIDVEMGELALRRSADARVRQFAETMIKDHTAVNKAAGALAGRLGVTPLDNGVSQSLRAGADAARTELSGIRAVDFDRAYMEREVTYHQSVLEALDKTLIPNASNSELRNLLVQARAAVAAHLAHAIDLRGVLGGAMR